MSEPLEVPARLIAALADRYAIEEPLGAGGMATVYLARDIKHDRKVAIKVLRPELAAVIGGERFVAEIRTTAALQHPHILPLFDSGEADTFLYYVMPYVEGESLRERLDREGQLPVDEAVRIARAVGSALHYAHERDIVHRDIKPANILMHAGEPVVADFGIAIAISAAGGGRLTETGMSVGTPHYMSPEQASADRDIDARSDTYALACVLYEMLAGQPPHTGPSAQAVLMRILTENPRPITDVRRSVPAHVRDALTKGLEKLAADRFRSSKEFADALADPAFSYQPVVVDATVQALPAVRQHQPAASNVGRFALPAAAAIIGLAAGATLFGGSPDQAVVRPVTTLTFEMEDLSRGGLGRIIVSPDERFYATIGQTEEGSAVFVRAADEPHFRPLAGTENAEWVTLSPDGEWIAFDDFDCGINVMPSTGGAARQVLPGLPDNECRLFLDWQGDHIVFSAVGPYPGRVERVPASGGSAEVLAQARSSFPTDPSLVPGGGAVLYADSDGGGVMFHEIGADSGRVLIPDAIYARVLSNGNLVHLDDGGGLWASRFDPEAGSILGDPIPVLSGVVVENGLVPIVSFSDNGTLVYLRGETAGGRNQMSQLQIVDFDGGGVTDVAIQSRRFRNVRWSPDGASLAFSALEPGESSGQTSIYTYNVDLRTATRRLTQDGTQAFPVWSPDGQRLAYLDSPQMSGPNNQALGPLMSGDLWVMNADGTGAERILEQEGQDVPYAWDQEGFVLHTGGLMTLTSDLLRAPVDRSESVNTYLDVDGDLGAITLSPDGRYAAFWAREETGTQESVEIEVRTYPVAGPPVRVSQGGGDRPRWSRDGSAIFYWKDDGAVDSLMMARVQTSPEFRVLSTELVLAGDYDTATWDLHPDGNRMIVARQEAVVAVEDEEEVPEPVYNVVINWFTRLNEILGEGN